MIPLIHAIWSSEQDTSFVFVEAVCYLGGRYESHLAMLRPASGHIYPFSPVGIN